MPSDIIMKKRGLCDPFLFLMVEDRVWPLGSFDQFFGLALIFLLLQTGHILHFCFAMIVGVKLASNHNYKQV